MFEKIAETSLVNISFDNRIFIRVVLFFLLLQLL